MRTPGAAAEAAEATTPAGHRDTHTGGLIPLTTSSTASATRSQNRSTLRQQVLSEEDYTTTLSRLIRRDFFPHLARLEAENAYLDALTHLEEPGGEQMLEEAVRRLVGHEVKTGIIPPTPRPGDTVRRRRAGMAATPGTAAWSSQTPLSDSATPANRDEWDPTPLVSRDSSGLELEHLQSGAEEPTGSSDTGAPSLEGLTLSSFQTNFTSEDNASFLELLEASQRRRKEAYRWAYDAEEEANRRRRLALEASHREAEAGFAASLGKAPEAVRRRLQQGWQPKLITSNSESGKTCEMPESSSSSSSSSLSSDLPLVGTAEVSPATDQHRPMQSWNHQARNALYYGPDADRATTQQRTSSLPTSSSQTRDNFDAFLASERVDRVPGINFSNTRLIKDDDDDAGGGSDTPRSSRIDAAIGGYLEPSSTGGSVVGERSGSIDGSVAPEESTTPRVSGYSFVSPLPSPRPGDLGEERVKQLMTWGTIIGTPRALGRASTGSAGEGGGASGEEAVYDGAFKMPPTPRRDLLARQLADKAGARRKRPAGSRHSSLQGLGGNAGAAWAAASPGRRDSTTPASKRTRADLSPAARTLLDRTSRGTSLGSSLLGRRNGAETGSGATATPESQPATHRDGRLRRERWTPTPSPKPRRAA